MTFGRSEQPRNRGERRHGGKRNKLRRPRSEPRQSKKCKWCIWGSWTGTKQFCSKHRCVKKGNPS
ncbi:hypothetical protein EIM92_14550 [Paenibacillus lentus]|uniref:Uncharacterized protein n=1 Tax=Paenibacillus lentus TaxID=1338368 RepID=A0A3S8RX09_9BACL|nr:hypothetical protein EIM92_14550 [Paenibacillus lentus]